MRVICAVVAVLVVGAWCLDKCPAQQAYDPFASRTSNATDRQYGVIASVEFVDAPITTVFKMISDLTGWSIVMSPEVSTKPPKINIWIKNLTPEQVLDQVAALGSLVIDREDKTVKVMTFEEYGRISGLTKQVIPLTHANPTQLAELLKPFVKKNDQARIVPDELSRKIVLLLPEPLLGSVTRLIEAIDVPLQQDAVEIVELKHADTSQITPMLVKFLTEAAPRAKERSSATRNIGQASVGQSWIIRFMAEPQLNLILLRGSPEDIKNARALIEKLDVPNSLQIVSYELKNTNADEVYETLMKILDSQQGGKKNQAEPGRLRCSLSMQNNCIIVEGFAKDHRRISQIIDAIDKPLSGDAGGVRVYRLENASASEVAEVIRQIAGQGGSVRRPGIDKEDDSANQQAKSQDKIASRLAKGAKATQPETRQSFSDIPAQITEAPEINAVVIKASAAEQAEFAKIIEEMDQPRDQVVLEVTLVTVVSEKSFDLGVELSGTELNGRGTESISFTSFGIGVPDPTTGRISLADPPPFGLNWSFFNSSDFSLVLNALETIGDVKISSAPKILVEDNSEARIRQFDQEPYETTSQGQASTITSFGGYTDAGIELNVTPHISQQDWLRLNYMVLLSSFRQRTRAQELANLPPPKTEAMAEGTVRVPAGHMVALGGLVNERNDDIEARVPYLADIPIIGELFKSRSKVRKKETLFIFIKPVLLRDSRFTDLIDLSIPDVIEAGTPGAPYPSNPLMLFEDSFSGGAL